ncbi:mitochondrial import receptor subunit TOM20 homolog B-like, partial [Plectropomus leopardus]|uniref:mitochondrial import receptor subunit TOM20 homolog B-like n=1 Tax=Plectropomus leopardus TaxID=160734 RepID=UPI001C4A9EA7
WSVLWSLRTLNVSSCLVFRSTGDYEKGVDHLTNAIAVCGQPQQLLQVLQQTLPPPVFQMLLTKLPSISQVRQTLRFILAQICSCTNTEPKTVYGHRIDKTGRAESKKNKGKIQERNC